jgi:hypothetical protein
MKKRIPSSIFKENPNEHRVDDNFQYNSSWINATDDEDIIYENSINPTSTSLVVRLLKFIISPVQELLFMCSWLIWLLCWIPFAGGSGIIALFTVIRIAIDLILYLIVLVLRKCNTLLYEFYWHVACYRQRSTRNRLTSLPWLRHHVIHAKSWEEWRYYASRLDKAEGNESWKRSSESDLYDYKMLNTQLGNLTKFRTTHDMKQLMFTLSHIFYRQYSGITNERLYLQCHLGTKYLIEEFYARVVEQLSYISRSEFNDISLKEKLMFLQRARRSYGRTALCLSGGGALALYHTGNFI